MWPFEAMISATMARRCGVIRKPIALRVSSKSSEEDERCDMQRV